MPLRMFTQVTLLQNVPQEIRDHYLTGENVAVQIFKLDDTKVIIYFEAAMHVWQRIKGKWTVVDPS